MDEKKSYAQLCFDLGHRQHLILQITNEVNEISRQIAILYPNGPEAPKEVEPTPAA